jgi:pyruvate dehydrogenase E1 component
VIAATEILEAESVPCDVVCLTSADLVFRALQGRHGLDDSDDTILDELFPSDRRAPIVSVIDGHPHTLSFLGTIHGVPIANLGVSDFGQSGDVDDLYRHFGIDTDTIVGAAIDLLETSRG